MKVLKVINSRSYLVRLSKREFEIVQWIMVNDDSLDPYFEITVHSDTLTCVVTQLKDKVVEVCLGYFNHCFANDMVDTMIRFDKINMLKTKI